eukprot:gene26878-35644_t
MKIRDAAGNFIGLKAQPLKLKEEEQGLLSVASSFTHVIDENSPLAGLNAKTLKQHVANISFIIQFKSCYSFNEEHPEELGTYDASMVHDVEVCTRNDADREQHSREKKSSALNGGETLFRGARLSSGGSADQFPDKMSMVIEEDAAARPSRDVNGSDGGHDSGFGGSASRRNHHQETGIRKMSTS